MLMCVGCLQYLPSDWLERPLWGHLNVVRRLPPQSPGGRECLCIFLLFGLSMFLRVPPSPTQYIFHTPMTRYSLFVLKVSLNTNKTNKQTNVKIAIVRIFLVRFIRLFSNRVSQAVIVIIDDISVILVLCFSVYRSLENLILSGMCAVLNLRVLLVLYLLYSAWAYCGC